MTKKTKKLTELLLYVALKSETDPNFGMTKLNKLMFYSDFGQFAKTGNPITETTYIKNHHGPTIKDLNAILEKMSDKGVAGVREKHHYGFPQKRLFALKEPDISIFEPQEIDTVIEVLEALKDLTGSQSSSLSHEFVGWKFARLGEEIPYWTVDILSPEKVASNISEEVIEQAGKYA